MRIVLVLLLTLMVCPFAQWLGSVAPPDSLASVSSEPHVEISTDPGIPQPGDTFTVMGIPVNVGLPYYTLTLSSGASVTVTYAGEVTSEVGDGYLARDDQFEITSVDAQMTQVTFSIKALRSGVAEAVISVTGEIRTPESAYVWGGAQSDVLRLMVVR